MGKKPLPGAGKAFQLWTRREFVAHLAACGALSPLFALAGATVSPVQQLTEPSREPPYKLSSYDEALLDELEKAACLYFWEQSNPSTGLVKDRSTPDEFDDYTIASIAATGFGLSALCIADKRGFIPSSAVVSRVRAALKFLARELYNQRGFFFHFVDINTGERAFDCEVSSIDTGLLLCGVLMCRQYFADPQIGSLAAEIFDRVDWLWMLNRGRTLSHGWTPEHGFLPYRWNTYCELMLIYLLGIGSRTHAIPASSWDAWWRPIFEYHGLRYIGSYAPLFVHQYSHAWFDFRGKRDRYANYFQNSVLATEAHRLFCISLHSRFPDFDDNLWGVTASDSVDGYTWWGGPPPVGAIDGTLVPCAPAGSLPEGLQKRSPSGRPAGPAARRAGRAPGAWFAVSACRLLRLDTMPLRSRDRHKTVADREGSRASGVDVDEYCRETSKRIGRHRRTVAPGTEAPNRNLR